MTHQPQLPRGEVDNPNSRRIDTTSTTSLALVEPIYQQWTARVDEGRQRLGHPLTYTEKVLWNHLRRPTLATPGRALSYAEFDPDRVALQDALAQIVALQLISAGLDDIAVPTSVHCDHLITAKVAAAVDLASALDDNREIYEFLRSFCAKFGIGFWKPGSGIIHQVVLENYAFPGGMMIGTDSHTPNAGGAAMMAIGVGGGDAIDVMTGQSFTVRWPRIIGVHLTGSLSGWSSPKDVILRVAHQLTVRGGTGAIIEYFGPGATSLSATGKATICNMGAEVGATTSLFAFDEHIGAYLSATGRGEIAIAASRLSSELRADHEVEVDPEQYFDQVIEVDLSSLTPLINGPDSPDLAHDVRSVGAWAKEHAVPTRISAALVGSCTNSSYEDMTRVAAIARQAVACGVRTRSQLLVTPGSEQVRATIERDGLLADLEAIGATVLANACGPCIGQWDRVVTDPSSTNTIVTSFNRNFPRRNDGNANTKAFVTSPEMVLLYALAGTLDFNPLADSISSESGSLVHFDPPVREELPSLGFNRGVVGYEPPPTNRTSVSISVASDSTRLQLLRPFPAWSRRDFLKMPVLLKAKGQCTTDQISAAGSWLRYRGHLENISANLFLGVVNAFSNTVGEGRDPLNGEVRPFPDIAKHLSDANVPWCAVGSDNYGEGSSREHAAMEPRYRGGLVIFARSFARIHETNLKKQGLLPLTFCDPASYDRICEDDLISVFDLAALAPDELIGCRLDHADGSHFDFECTHSFSEEQIEWFRAGSALNVIAEPSTRVSS